MRARARSRSVPDDQLGDHRVVEGRSRRPPPRRYRRARACPLPAAPDAAACRWRAGSPGRIFGVDARLQRMAVDRQLLLGQRQRARRPRAAAIPPDRGR
jgi:hypothetical protein